MPILMSDDTRRVIKAGANLCSSRSLLQSRFVFLDNEPDKNLRLEEGKRIALNLVVEGGAADLQRLRADADKEIHKQSRQMAKAQRLKVETTPLVGDRAKLHTIPASTAWLDVIPAERKRLIKLTTASRLIIGMANGVLENAGLTLHRFFGIPCIPGSASKAVARDACAASPDHAPQLVDVFGNEQSEKRAFQQGKVCFLPAYPTSNDPRIELDILTPHFAKYYTATGNPNAEDIEGPNPQVFPAVGAGEEFVFPLVVMNARLSNDECKALLDTAEHCLIQALTTTGIGAKTAAGYGRFAAAGQAVGIRQDLFPPPPMPELSLEDQIKANWQGKKISTFSLKNLIADLARIDDAPTLIEVFDAVMPAEHLTNFRTANPFWADFKMKGGDVILAKMNRTLPRQ